jgi:RimJ/RimL family protein N-acetyltransferase
MSWFSTGAVEVFLAEAGDFLRSERARNTVILTVTENLRVKALAQPAANTPDGRLAGHDEPLFGWWRSEGGQVSGAFMHTPDFPVMLTFMSKQAAAALAGELDVTGRQVHGVNAGIQAAEAFADVWRYRTGYAAEVQRRMRLFLLDSLLRPDPEPEGAPRRADERDRNLLIEWFDEFAREVGDLDRQDHADAVDERLSYGGLTIWQAASVPASVAGLTRTVDKMARVGPVYTPPALRGRGYAAGVTAAVSQAALDAGATEVVLYTDLANPTSNALYERLGYRPVEDRLMLSFDPPATP